MSLESPRIIQLEYDRHQSLYLEIILVWLNFGRRCQSVGQEIGP
jgi:hypothetical protein